MKARDVCERLKKMVIHNYAGKKRQGNFGSRGLAIYFPHSNKAYQSDPDKDGYQKGNNNYPVEFVQTQTWADFLHAYFAKVP
jgi:hypothetical protein